MIPKILHLYWGRNKPLSWMRWMTVWSFSQMNPDWKIIVWFPKKPGKIMNWTTKEHALFSWAGEDWFNKMENAGDNVEVREAPIDDFPDMTDVHRSDLLRWRLLHTIGGFWSDFDIFYFRPMTVLNADMTKDALLCWGEIKQLEHWQAIGFLAGKQGCNMFKEMEKQGLQIARSPRIGYQDLGTNLLTRFAMPKDTESIGSKIGQISQYSVYPFSSVESEMRGIWEDFRLLDLRNNTVGIHWFAAQRRSCREESILGKMADFTDSKLFGGIGKAMRIARFAPEIDESLFKIKYSFLIPYMDRIIQFRNTLVSFLHWYSRRIDWELIVVLDSKCSEVPQVRKNVDLLLKRGGLAHVIDPPSNGTMYNPSMMFNAAAKAAQGTYLLITSPEVLHRADILAGLDHEFAQNPNGYVVCACMSKKPPVRNKTIRRLKDFRALDDKWYQHSQFRPAMYHFCSAISKDIYMKIGGFDEEYAQGYCFDDDDFINKIKQTGIEIIQRDDLLTFHQDHPKVKPPDHMTLWRKNKAIFERKWGAYKHLEPARP